MPMVNPPKSIARKAARRQRMQCQDTSAGVELIRHFPAVQFRGASIGGYWPLSGEINICPLMQALQNGGHFIGLPRILGPELPLEFRLWTQGGELYPGPFKTLQPASTQPVIIPELVLVPLLAFTADGARLGYGGGYYDRTIECLRRNHNVFACGVAYAGQETANLPTEAHDVSLDAILTQDYFKAFS